MRCSYCGQENPDGAVFCKCGRPISLDRDYSSYGNQQNSLLGNQQNSLLGNQTGASMGNQMGTAPMGNQMGTAPMGNQMGTTPMGNQMGGYMGGQMSPFPRQTLDQVKHKKAVPVGPIVVVILVVLVVAGFFGYQGYLNKSMTDESKWITISGSGYSIKAPKAMKKGDMVQVLDEDAKLLDFYTSREAGFDVSVYHYTADEKKLLSGMGAQEYLATITLGGKRTRKVNGQDVTYEVREGKNYIYSNGIKLHRQNYVRKSDDIYYIEAMFPYEDGYYQVNVYCAESDKSKYEDVLMKWLDSFTVK